MIIKNPVFILIAVTLLNSFSHLVAQPKYETSIGGEVQLIPYWGYNKVRGGFITMFINKPGKENTFGFFLNYVKVGPDLRTSFARLGVNYNLKFLKKNKWFDTYALANFEFVNYNYERPLLRDEKAFGICLCVGPRFERNILKKWSIGAEGGYGPYFVYLFNDYESVSFNSDQVKYKNPRFGVGVFIHYNVYLKFKLN